MGPSPETPASSSGGVSAASVTVTRTRVTNVWDMGLHVQHRLGPQMVVKTGKKAINRKSRTQRPSGTNLFSLRPQMKTIQGKGTMLSLYLELSRTVLFKGTAVMKCSTSAVPNMEVTSHTWLWNI